MPPSIKKLSPQKLPVPPINPIEKVESKISIANTFLTEVTKPESLGQKPGTAGTNLTSKWGGENNTAPGSTLSTPRNAALKGLPKVEEKLRQSPEKPEPEDLHDLIKSPTLDDLLGEVEKSVQPEVQEPVKVEASEKEPEIQQPQPEPEEPARVKSITPNIDDMLDLPKPKISQSQENTTNLEKILASPNTMNQGKIELERERTRIKRKGSKTSILPPGNGLNFDNPSSNMNSRKNSWSSERHSLDRNSVKKEYNFTPEVDNLYRGLPSQGALINRLNNSIRKKTENRGEKKDSFEDIFKQPGAIKVWGVRNWSQVDEFYSNFLESNHSPTSCCSRQKSPKKATSNTQVKSPNFYAKGDKEMPLPSKKVLSPRQETLSPQLNSSQSPSQHQMEQFLSRLEKYNITDENIDENNIFDLNNPMAIFGGWWQIWVKFLKFAVV